VTRALEAAGTVEVARIERSGMIESRHLGAAAVVDGAGTVIHAVGDIGALVYPRSTLKPIQAVAMLRAGAPLAGPALVLATASHAGSPEHIAVVKSMLASSGLTADALQCPVDWPLGREYANQLIRDSAQPTRLHMNCSGKHAGFLAACVSRSWSTADYLDPAHPLQEAVRDTVVEFTGEPVEHSGTDGCGAPVHAVTLAGLARAIGRIAGSTEGEPAVLASAIREHPWAIDGRGRANTIVVEQLGLIAKLGAEGVMVMGARTGHAVAVKILDGSLRAATLVALELLVESGVVTRDAVAPVLEATTERVLGGGVPVGRLLVTIR
jgi:L-asparaginase II